MSVYGLMRTGASGMAAQSNRLGAVADNIANAGTTGYKAASAEFASLLLDQTASSYASGGVESDMRFGISTQGALSFSSSPFDLAINGNGFFVVQDNSGRTMLTRAGAFVPDEAGRLTNAAGYMLLGVPAGAASGFFAVNSIAGLEPVIGQTSKLEAMASQAGVLTANLPAYSNPVAVGDLPSANAATSESTSRTSMVVYGNLGEEILLDVHFAQTATAGNWEVSVYSAADRSPAGSFPYSSAPLTTGTLSFGPNGQLTTTSLSTLTIPVPGGSNIDLDLSRVSQLAGDFKVIEVNADGNAPSDVTAVEIGSDGTLYSIYENGARRAGYRIPLATVVSVDQLTPVSGNVFQLSNESGDLRVGFADGGGLGKIVSGALENSTVDLANELTDMIEAQRNYTANSRVFQTGSELLDVLVNLKR